MSSATQKKIIVFSSFAGCMCRTRFICSRFPKTSRNNSTEVSRRLIKTLHIKNITNVKHPVVTCQFIDVQPMFFTKTSAKYFFFKALTVRPNTRSRRFCVRALRSRRQTGRRRRVRNGFFFYDTRYHRMSRSTPFVQLDLSLKYYSNDNCVPLRLIRFRFIKLTVTSCWIFTAISRHLKVQIFNEQKGLATLTAGMSWY